MPRRARDKIRELERRVESTKLRYETEVEEATKMFTGPDARQTLDLLGRWQAQRQKVMEAFTEYRAAVDAYLDAARWRRER